MPAKPIVRNEHRESFAAGKFDEIPAEALAILQAQAPKQKEAVKVKKPDEASKE